MSAHTPGPWTRMTNGESGKNLAFGQEGSARVLGLVYGTGYPIGKGWSPESEANARLIAAAPEMLTELRQWVADCFCQQDSIRHPDGCGHCEASRAAIAKAEGEAVT